MVSPATVNKELRHLKAAFNKAYEWEYLPQTPKVHLMKEPQRLITYVTPSHFAEIYEACRKATRPHGYPFTAEAWWKAFLIFTYMTGWRVGEPLALRREDIDLDACEAITWADDNKGGRDERVPLHSVVVDHLQTIKSFEPVVFPWPHHRRTLDVEFHAIQKATGIHLPYPFSRHLEHECSDACHLYGFHDLRRAFATTNAEVLSADALKALMRHQSYSTTQRYINMAEQVKKSIDKLKVPDFLARHA